MKLMRMLVAITVSAILTFDSIAAVRGTDAAYVGGTVSDLKKGVEGSLDTSDTKELRFDHKGGQFALPYHQISSMEFGQKVGRRVGAALVGMAFLGLPGLIILASKKKKHFLTIGYRDDAGQGQAAVFEVAKGVVSSIIPSLEVRTGKRVEMESGGDGWGDAGHADAPHIPLPIAAAPAPKIAQTAELTVQSDPPGAEVIVDFKSYGRTPVTFAIPSGSNYIVMRRDGFESWKKDLVTKPGETVTVNGELKRSAAESSSIIAIKGQ